MHMQSVPRTTAPFQRIIENKKHCTELASVDLQVCSITQKKVQATVTTYSSLSHWHAYHCIVKVLTPGIWYVWHEHTKDGSLRRNMQM